MQAYAYAQYARSPMQMQALRGAGVVSAFDTRASLSTTGPVETAVDTTTIDASTAASTNIYASTPRGMGNPFASDAKPDVASTSGAEPASPVRLVTPLMGAPSIRAPLTWQPAANLSEIAKTNPSPALPPVVVIAGMPLRTKVLVAAGLVAAFGAGAYAAKAMRAKR